MFNHRVVRKFYMPILRWSQRHWRGWDDSETWSIEHSAAEFVLTRMKRLRIVKKEICGPSSMFFPKGGIDDTPEGWAIAQVREAEVYDDIEYFLEQFKDGSDGYVDTDEIERECIIDIVDDKNLTHKVDEWKFNIYKKVRDERFFRGRHYLIKYLNTMWW